MYYWSLNIQRDLTIFFSFTRYVLTHFVYKEKGLGKKNDYNKHKAGAKYFSSQMSLQNWYLWKAPEISQCLKVLPQHILHRVLNTLSHVIALQKYFGQKYSIPQKLLKKLCKGLLRGRVKFAKALQNNMN